MNEIRPRKETDQENTDKAFWLIKELIRDHPEIESTLWGGAVWSVLVDGYVLCGCEFNRFEEEIEKMKTHYKPWFDKD